MDLKAGENDSVNKLEQVGYSLAQLAILLDTTEAALRMEIQRGGVNLPPRVKRGAKWFFPRRLVEQWLAELEARAVAASRPRRGPGRPRKVAPPVGN